MTENAFEQYALDNNLWVYISRGNVRQIQIRVINKTPVAVGLQKTALDPSSRYWAVIFGFDDGRSCFLAYTGGTWAVTVPYDEFNRAWALRDNWMIVVCPPDRPGWGLNAGEFISRGWFYEKRGEYAKALQDFGAASRVGADLAEAFLGMGNAYSGMRRDEEAVRAYRRAIAWGPRRAEAYNNLAWLLACRSTNLTEAVSLAHQAVVLAPSSAVAWDSLGVALYRQGNYKESADALERARGKARQMSVSVRTDIALHLACTYLEDGQLLLARQVLQDVVEMNPHSRMIPELRSWLRRVPQ